MQSNSLSRSTPTIISSRVIGVLVLIFVEGMFFSALVSSYFVMKKGRDIWNAAGSIHLPVMAAGFNTLVLFASCVSLFLAGRSFKNQQNTKMAASHLLRALILGVFFLTFQAYLTVQLINAGMTITSSVYGGCYHLLVGFHLTQVLLGVFFMGKFYQNLLSDKPKVNSTIRDHFNSLQIFWLFVVGIWPVLYAEIYF